MALAFHPSESIGFNRPLTRQGKVGLILSNRHAEPIMFIVKVSSKRYSVRPNAGRIEAGDRCEVLIVKHPLDEEPPESEPCMDKFLFESAFIDPDQDMFSCRDSEFWDTKRAKNAIHQKKIPVTYLPALELVEGELLKLNPRHYITFWGPFTDESIATLTLENPTMDPVAFKIRTSSSKDFAVYPNTGRIEALEDFRVKFFRKAFPSTPSPEDIVASIPKIQILSAAIPSSHTNTPIPDLFKLGEFSDSTKIYAQKLLVRYPGYSMKEDKDDIVFGNHISKPSDATSYTSLTSRGSVASQSSTLLGISARPPPAYSAQDSVLSFQSSAVLTGTSPPQLRPLHRGIPEENVHSKKKSLSGTFRRLLR